MPVLPHRGVMRRLGSGDLEGREKARGAAAVTFTSRRRSHYLFRIVRSHRAWTSGTHCVYQLQP